MFKNILKVLTIGLASLGIMASSGVLAAPADNGIKVVYHIDDNTRSDNLLRNVKNHLDASPGVKIVVVGHGKGIDFMLKNAQDANGNPYDVAMQSLATEGVEFRVCNNTLKSRKLTADAVAYPATIVPSGVAEVARLQAKEGYVYLKP
ncbi:DsrE family protein [Sulfuriferula sp.]|uniref:DsrE family protein n=1 Tax=Sulfuriferula sp. TaxID=2025307 RepID=UPI00272F7EEA|nr:DsrE family protein [Sulfuriferula sp.]MDP2026682.1 DsrE family protein [Sulfuriferula sp.]